MNNIWIENFLRDSTFHGNSLANIPHCFHMHLHQAEWTMLQEMAMVFIWHIQLIAAPLETLILLMTNHFSLVSSTVKYLIMLYTLLLAFLSLQMEDDVKYLIMIQKPSRDYSSYISNRILEPFYFTWLLSLSDGHVFWLHWVWQLTFLINPFLFMRFWCWL